ncbi:DNA cytosine methyltransferase [Pseudomonas putida]|uniref:DNA cytosine methyltransferase n=1 Tax=Pseudomonas TaxID=286 RepID=UPI00062A36C1|nr:DNA cytosine methyltransferase [Pseudomonas putida]
MPITYGSVCSGIEAATVAWEPLGWQPSWYAEIEPFPSAVLAHHYPDTPNLGDMTRLAAMVLSGKIPAPEVLVGGTPCFTAGHLVLTENGYATIETIKPGDMVMTHLGRLRRVVRIGAKQAPVGTLKAVGLREPLTVTENHPFLAVSWRNQGTKRNGQYARIEHYGDPCWVEAKDMPGRQWCALTAYERVESAYRSTKFSEREAMYVAGMYLGDGHIRRWGEAGKKALVLSLNEAKLEKLKQVIGEAGFSVSHERTTLRVTICDTALCEWLHEQFGKLSHLKRIPAWALGHAHRALLLQGYLDTDGTAIRSGVSISTVSRSLAYGVADLLNAEGRSASVGLIQTSETCVIEGRTVNQRDWYQVRAFDNGASRKSRVRHGYLLRTVQSYTNAGIDTVFNIEVEDDNSYVINGAVVHNCQAFSVAGMREGLADPRGALTIKYVELLDAIDHVRTKRGQPEATCLWENVPGVLSDKGNAFGCFLGALVGESEELQPPGGKWKDAGCVYGPTRTAAWRILDAQYFGLAQRRRRVFVVASARAGFDPLEVLFEREGVRRDTPPRRGEGQDLAGRAPFGPALQCGCGWVFGLDLGQYGCPNCEGDEGPAVEVLAGMPAYGGHSLQGDVSQAATLTAKDTRMDMESETFCIVPTLDASFGRLQGCSGQDANHGHGHLAVHGTQDPDVRYEQAHTLGRNNGMENAVLAFAENSRAEVRLEGGDGQVVGTLSAGGGKPGQGQPCIAFSCKDHGEVAGTLGANHGNIKAEHAWTGQLKSMEGGVRRLTPRECEWLQGFPGDHTRIPYRGKPADECPDGPRYKAIGNSKAVFVVGWIGRRIQQQLERLA